MTGLHFGHYAELLEQLPDQSVRLFLVDSPYGNTDLDFDKQPVDWQGEFWPLVRRKMLPDGVVVCFACEGFTLDLIASNRAWYRYRMVWAKSRASRYPDISWRPLAGHEDLVVFAPAIKSAVYNPQKLPRTGAAKSCQRKDNKTLHYNATRLATAYADDGTRYPTTLLEYASVGTTAPHLNSTAKPPAMMQYLVLTYSNPGDLVVEPFAGDAPTAHACLNTGRRYVGCEINPAQYEWSQQRLQQHSPLFSPAAARLA